MSFASSASAACMASACCFAASVLASSLAICCAALARFSAAFAASSRPLGKSPAPIACSLFCAAATAAFIASADIGASSAARSAIFPARLAASACCWRFGVSLFAIEPSSRARFSTAPLSISKFFDLSPPRAASISASSARMRISSRAAVIFASAASCLAAASCALIAFNAARASCIPWVAPFSESSTFGTSAKSCPRKSFFTASSPCMSSMRPSTALA